MELEEMQQRLWEALSDAFRAGFLASGEGWNGEYPHHDKRSSVDAWLYANSADHADSVIDGVAASVGIPITPNNTPTT